MAIATTRDPAAFRRRSMMVANTSSRAQRGGPMPTPADQKHEYRFADLAGGMLDQIICSCGWESATFFDGREYAYSQWRRHTEGLPSGLTCVAAHSAGLKE
jgi:hypothetical protein